ncbi:MAG: hypothetical protein HKO08_03155 [Erythrobacter sp.]|nr:hypothetical protein [Erythrobacter sp.]
MPPLDIAGIDCSAIADFAGDGACRIVLESICNRSQSGLETTVWELHQATGLPLHEAFAALRTLEYGKVIAINDNPSDPFGAKIQLLLEGLSAVTRRNVA